MQLLESGQMYLETIYILSQKDKNVRSLDVAEYMNFSKPSVCRAVGLLKSGGYLVSDDNGYLSLTEARSCKQNRSVIDYFRCSH